LECLDKTASIEYLLNNHLISGNLVETEKWNWNSMFIIEDVPDLEEEAVSWKEVVYQLN
jgi:hypothetical protein